MIEEVVKEFIENAIYRIDENSQKLTRCVAEFDEPGIWKRPNQNSNSMGNIILHLCGNIRQYAISSLGKKEDIRERDKEFSVDGGHSKTELLGKFMDVIDEAKHIIRNISVDELLRKRQVQGFTQSGIGIIIHVTEHLSYHTGQIIFWTKLLKNKDLGFYAGVDLNTKNKI
jgi:uncharacterized damage-inducible protein DinB